MAGNIATLKPITPGDPRAGRKVGQTNITTRLLKRALLMAAELSEHSDNQGLVGYCTWLSNTRPELYVAMLSRLIPIQAKLKTDFVRPQELTSDMPLDQMMIEFERKIRDPNYHPRAIENDARDYDDGDDE